MMTSARGLYDIRLRDVEMDDLPIFFEHQCDPDANHMTALPSRGKIRQIGMLFWHTGPRFWRTRLTPFRPFSSMEVWLAQSQAMWMKMSTWKSLTGLESPIGAKALRPVHSQPFSNTTRYVLCTPVQRLTMLPPCACWRNVGLCA
jgi:hypothetical protein